MFFFTIFFKLNLYTSLWIMDRTSAHFNTFNSLEKILSTAISFAINLITFIMYH